MIGPESYCAVEALIEHEQKDWMGDGVLCQLVTVMMTDDMCLSEPAVCALTAQEARDLAFDLLVLAERAERLTRHREDER
jgi:hypothetical protein